MMIIKKLFIVARWKTSDQAREEGWMGGVCVGGGVEILLHCLCHQGIFPAISGQTMLLIYKGIYPLSQQSLLSLI